MFDNQNLKNQPNSIPNPVSPQNSFVPPKPQVNYPETPGSYSQPVSPVAPNAQSQFSPVPNQPVVPKNSIGGVEDMFASTDNPYGAPKYSSQLSAGGNSYARMPRPMKAQNIYGGGFGFSKLLIPFLVVVVLILLGIAGWLSYNYIYTRGSMEADNINLSQSSTDNSINFETDIIDDSPIDTIQAGDASASPLVAPAGVPIPVIGSANNSTSSSILSAGTSSSQNQQLAPDIALKDNDSDGLTDDEERNIGTNPLISDTDSDGLTDYAEMRIYYSNPLVLDTDNDGFKDGQEVINGFDPNKSGGARLPTTTPVNIK